MVFDPLSIEQLDVHAGSLQLLHALSFSLHPGELCGLIGPSGAGKSTLIKVMLGLIRPSKGSIMLGKRALTANTSIGYVPQEDALHRSLTVRQALTYSARLRLPSMPSQEHRKKIDELCAKVGLDERLDVRIKRLSGGQRKRVSVAMELLTEPSALILDEPTSGLDPGMEERLMQLFVQVAQSGRIVLVATHAMENLRLCHALLVLVRGHRVYFGPPDGALEFFRVDRFAAIFSQLDKQPPAAWSSQFAKSSIAPQFATRSAPRLLVPAASHQSLASTSSPTPTIGGKQADTTSQTTTATATYPAKPPAASESPPLSAAEKLRLLKEQYRKKEH